MTGVLVGFSWKVVGGGVTESLYLDIRDNSLQPQPALRPGWGGGETKEISMKNIGVKVLIMNRVERIIESDQMRLHFCLKKTKNLLWIIMNSFFFITVWGVIAYIE